MQTPRALCCLVIAGLLLPAFASARTDDTRLGDIVYEARQTIAVVEWFYVRSRACPLPSRPAELALIRERLGDGFSAEPGDVFLEIRGIGMSDSWRYYASPSHPETCTLLRSVGRDATLIWRWHRGIGHWSFSPGDGRPERPIKPTPDRRHTHARLSD